MRIFNGIPSNGINETARWQNGTALYLVAPDITDELEIDFFLQVELNGSDNRLLRLTELFVLDSVLILPIPIELQGIGLNLYGAFTTELRDFLEIYVLEGNTTNTILEELRELREVVDNEIIRETIADSIESVADLQQNLGLGILSTALSGITAGLSLPATGNFTTAVGTLSQANLQQLLL